MSSPYTDLDRPPLNAAGLRRALLRPGGLWTSLDVLAQTGSTNADVAGAAAGGEPEGMVVVAEQQTAGRGRLERQWVSPARAGLAVSVLLRPARPDPDRGWSAVASTRFGWLPLLAGLALAESVRQVTGLEAVLKWPNDLLIGEAKCAGILAEAVGPAAAAVVVGMGLNVSLRSEELPTPASGLPATSLALAGAEHADRDPLLRALLRAFAGWYRRWRATGGDAHASGVREAYERNCATLGRRVRLLRPDGGLLVGLASELDDEGRLLVRPDGGPAQPVAAGDIRHLR